MRTLIVAAFAAHRAARALTIEKISIRLRTLILNWSIDVDASDAELARRWWINELFKCPHCVGFWLSGMTLIVYASARRFRLGWLCRLVECWAVAGLQSSLTSLQAHHDSATEHADAQVKLMEERQKL